MLVETSYGEVSATVNHGNGHVPNSHSHREQFGFREGDRGTHSSRTMMLAELTLLLDQVPSDAKSEDYLTAILKDNVLEKQTYLARKLSVQKLRELYGLNPELTIFRLLRFFWSLDEKAQPTLALLCALARDPLLRLSIDVILQMPLGETFNRQEIEQVITQTAPDRFTASTLSSIARNISSSWTQSGYLAGKVRKIRTQPVITVATMTYAIALGYLEGHRGQTLLGTLWVRVLGLPTNDILALMREAARRSWLDYRGIGSMIEIRFPQLLAQKEQRWQ